MPCADRCERSFLEEIDFLSGRHRLSLRRGSCDYREGDEADEAAGWAWRNVIGATP
jgi:hypothetical protein